MTCAACRAGRCKLSLGACGSTAAARPFTSHHCPAVSAPACTAGGCPQRGTGACLIPLPSGVDFGSACCENSQCLTDACNLATGVCDCGAGECSRHQGVRQRCRPPHLSSTTGVPAHSLPHCRVPPGHHQHMPEPHAFLQQRRLWLPLLCRWAVPYGSLQPGQRRVLLWRRRRVQPGASTGFAALDGASGMSSLPFSHHFGRALCPFTAGCRKGTTNGCLSPAPGDRSVGPGGACCSDGSGGFIHCRCLLENLHICFFTCLACFAAPLHCCVPLLLQPVQERGMRPHHWDLPGVHCTGDPQWRF